MIHLNPLKKGADNVYHKLEISVGVDMDSAEEAVRPSTAFCAKHVNNLQANSNCQLEFSYDFGRTQVLACLFGPSLAAFASK